MRLTKHHGLGNDFLVLLDDLEVGPALARRLCDRRRGIGADGLIVGRPPATTQDGFAPRQGRAGSPAPDVVMVLRNADGSRAEMSGNGVRCLAQAVLHRAGREAGIVVVATDAGSRRVEVSATVDPLTCEGRVDMGPVTIGPPWAVPLPNELVRQLDRPRPRLCRVDVGNPHVVVEAADPGAVDLERFGPWFEAQVPGGVNVGFVAVRAGRLALRVWERGAGVTEACGTGATAAAAAAHGWGLVGPAVRVGQQGGEVSVELGPRATLVGPATYVAAIEVPELASTEHDTTAEPLTGREVVHG